MKFLRSTETGYAIEELKWLRPMLIQVLWMSLWSWAFEHGGLLEASKDEITKQALSFFGFISGVALFALTMHIATFRFDATTKLVRWVNSNTLFRRKWGEIPFENIRALEVREEEKVFGIGWRIWLVTDENEIVLSWKISSNRAHVEKIAAQIRAILDLPAPDYEEQAITELRERGYDAAVARARRELFGGNVIQASEYVNDLQNRHASERREVVS